ncbi:hypothetical protein [Streptomyces sp. PsTaAH-124]|uniref:hypothetical protein n=1 Tax=Streptomyces sp. PsTaAH-124 TaxID=1157638 RepID=UPI0003653C4B|nr:hypothetical protein [Streptomyces sp. PsTaAH-124]
MPFPSPSQAPSGPRRRSLLASAAGAALLAGCSAGGDSSGDSGGGPSLADRVRAGAARDSENLARRYDAVLAAHPALAGRLAPLRAEVARHAAAFGGAGASAAVPSPSATATAGSGDGATPPASPAATDAVRAAVGGGGAAGTAGPSGSGGAAASASAGVPARPGDALASLAAAERSLADRRTDALLQVPGELARLLASVAAAGAAHAYLLTEGGK